jgi:hypothetical protein
LIVCLLAGESRAQQFPVAVDDYAEAELGQTITLKVTANDYHPQNYKFKVFIAPGSMSFTDSTITYKIDYELYYNLEDSLAFAYTIIDENNNSSYESIAKVHLKILNNNYFGFIDINNIKARVQASGTQFYRGPVAGEENPASNVYEFPSGSGKMTIFNSTLWFGALDEVDNLHVAAERFRQNGIDYWPGPLSMNQEGLSIDTSTVVKWQKVWRVSSQEIVYHRNHFIDEDYVVPDDILNWPAHGDENLNQQKYLAPFVDVDNDGVYQAMKGDYPLIRGDECIYFIINDLRNHGESKGDSLGIEIHAMAYAFTSQEEAFKNTVFYSYKVFNRSKFDYHDVYVGLHTDFDIGYAWDDFVGCDVKRGTYYAYNGDSIDGTINNEPEAYDGDIPAQGVVILGGPRMNANNKDDAANNCDESINGIGFGDGIVDNERLGMSKFLWYGNSISGANGDPSTDIDYYNYLKANWKDGTAMEYGGNGHFSSGAYGPAANFMFPGLSDPCYWGTDGEEPYGPVDWTEISAQNTPSDRRGLASIGPFGLKSGDYEKIDIAYVSSFAVNGETAVESMLNKVDFIRNEYLKNSDYFGYQWLGTNENMISNEPAIKMFPNPALSFLNIKLNTFKKHAFEYFVFDISGRLVLNGKGENGTSRIDVCGLDKGVYILKIRLNNKNINQKFIKY